MYGLGGLERVRQIIIIEERQVKFLRARNDKVVDCSSDELL